MTSRDPHTEIVTGKSRFNCGADSTIQTLNLGLADLPITVVQTAKYSDILMLRNIKDITINTLPSGLVRAPDIVFSANNKYWFTKGVQKGFH